MTKHTLNPLLAYEPKVPKSPEPLQIKLSIKQSRQAKIRFRIFKLTLNILTEGSSRYIIILKDFIINQIQINPHICLSN